MNFISFSYCIITASRTGLNTSTESQHLCLVHDFREKAFNMKYDISCKDSGVLRD